MNPKLNAQQAPTFYLYWTMSMDTGLLYEYYQDLAPSRLGHGILGALEAKVKQYE